MLDHKVIVASDSTARIQEAHTLLLHMVLEQVEEILVPIEQQPREASGFGSPPKRPV